MEAIILAGGLGTRLRPVIKDLPKPMADVNGKPFLAHLMDYWIKQGVKRFILSVGYKSEIIRDYFGDEYNGVSVAYSIEKKPLGTGGGLLLALKQLNSREDCLVLNGDSFFKINLKDFLDFHKEKKADLTMALKKLDQNDRYMGVALDEDNRVVNLSLQSDANGFLINGGIYLIKPTVFDGFEYQRDQKISLEAEIFPALLKEQVSLYGHAVSEDFIDIGMPEDYDKMKNWDYILNS